MTKTANAQREDLREDLRRILGMPLGRCELAPESRGAVERDGVVIEKWIWTSEPGSRVPCALYRPAASAGRMPAVVLTCGHGGSKSQWQYVYAGQLYAKMGLACLVLDPIGEEERHIAGGIGTRAHDPEPVHDCADQAGRLIMGKLVFDTVRGIDFLESRDDIDAGRIGVAGNSLGGAKATWMLALDTRLKLALVSGWAICDYMTVTGKFCTRVPYQRLRQRCDWPELLSLAAPHCAVLFLNGDADTIIDRKGDDTAWVGMRKSVADASAHFAAGHLDCWFAAGGGHRPYHCYTVSLEWMHRYLGTPGWTLDQIRSLPTVNSGAWCDQQGIELEKLYGNQLHQRGAALPDLGLATIPREDLTCLRADECGDPQYTLEGWLAQIVQPSR